MLIWPWTHGGNALLSPWIPTQQQGFGRSTFNQAEGALFALWLNFNGILMTLTPFNNIASLLLAVNRFLQKIQYYSGSSTAICGNGYSHATTWNYTRQSEMHSNQSHNNRQNMTSFTQGHILELLKMYKLSGYCIQAKKLCSCISGRL